MHVELIGTTGAGKSTLASRIVKLYRSRGIDAILGDDFVLGQFKLSWIRLPLLRTLLVDAASIAACLATWRANARYYGFAIRQIRSLPGDVGRFERFNLLRNVFKKAGIYEIIKRRGSGHTLILVDEGTLQSAHNLFVHVSYPHDPGEIAAFAKVVQLPDAALHVSQPEPVLVDRTARRGHKRIPKDSPENVTLFIQRAIDTFAQLARELATSGRLIERDEKSTLLVRPDFQDIASIDRFLAMARASQTAIKFPKSRKEHGTSALVPGRIGLRGSGNG